VFTAWRSSATVGGGAPAPMSNITMTGAMPIAKQRSWTVASAPGSTTTMPTTANQPTSRDVEGASRHPFDLPFDRARRDQCAKNGTRSSARHGHPVATSFSGVLRRGGRGARGVRGRFMCAPIRAEVGLSARTRQRGTARTLAGSVRSFGTHYSRSTGTTYFRQPARPRVYSTMQRFPEPCGQLGLQPSPKHAC
jgi:hypothetical protein